MECNFYDGAMNRVGSVQTCISLYWEETYNTEGTFEIELQMVDGLLDFVKPDYYVMLKGNATPMVIKSVQLTTDHTILIDGYTATHILSERVSTDVIRATNAENAMRGLVSTNFADWPVVALGASGGISDTFSNQTSDGTVLEYLQTIAAACDIGFRFRRDGQKLRFECYKPAENPNAKFSTMYGNVTELTYCASTMDYKNVAVVAGAGSGDDRVTVTVGDLAATGAGRREMYIDARSLQPEEKETSDAYAERLRNHGRQKLLEQIQISNVDFSIAYDADVSVGDVVFVAVPEFGVRMKTRVTGITIESEENILRKTLNVGTGVVSGSASSTGSTSVNGVSTGAGSSGGGLECVTAGTFNSSNAISVPLESGYYLFYLTHPSTTNNVGEWIVNKSSSGGTAFHLSRETTPHSFAFSASAATISTTVTATITARYIKIY